MSSGHVEQLSTVVHSHTNGATSTQYTPVKLSKRTSFAFVEFCHKTKGQTLPSNTKLFSATAINSNHSSANIRVNLKLGSLGPYGLLLTEPPKGVKIETPPNPMSGCLVGHQKARNPAPDIASTKKDSLYRYMQQIDGTLEHSRCLNDLQTLDWSTLTVSQFVFLSTKDLVWTSALQKFLNVNSHIGVPIEKLVLQTVSTLFFDKFGCHILRIMVKKSKEVLKYVYYLTFHQDFRSVCMHESGCKVIQAACEVDPFIRSKCLQSVLADWDNLKQSIFTFYLFTVCLKLTDSSSQEFEEVYKFLLSNCDTIFKGKYDKRFLVTMVECCREDQLLEIYLGSQLEKNLSTRGRDKYVIFTFLTFVSRGLQRAKQHLKHLRENPTATTSRIERMARSIKRNILLSEFAEH